MADTDIAQLSLRARREMRKSQAKSVQEVPGALLTSTQNFIRQPSSVTLNNFVKEIRVAIDPELESAVKKDVVETEELLVGRQICTMFQWKDDNVHGDDRVGVTVTLCSGGRIIPANAHTNADLIVGVVSVEEALILNNPKEWPQKYSCDKWGRQSEALNPSFDSQKAYVQRTRRKEWAQVATKGYVLVRKNQLVNKRWLFVRAHTSDISEYFIY